MSNITTEAWVLHPGPAGAVTEPARLELEAFSFPDITEYEILAEPLYGCWEGNMTHALERKPIDICRYRGEKQVVIGNGGVVRVLRIGSAVTGIKEGDTGIFFFAGVTDKQGYMEKIAGYDAAGSIGLLAKQMKLRADQFLPIPTNSRHTLDQWAAFSLRYLTAWSNWRVAYGSWRLQMTEADMPSASVWGWGGGVSVAELSLARMMGCRTYMISSRQDRLRAINELGIVPIDRRPFADLDFDEERYAHDADYRDRYLAAEKAFIDIVMKHTDGEGVSIFIDNIGLPVFRATLKVLARQGLVTTVGWKLGMNMKIIRAIECIQRHTHIYTHAARYSESVEAVSFAEDTGWLPPVSEDIYPWEDIPRLADDYQDGNMTSYFPVFQVNHV